MVIRSFVAVTLRMLHSSMGVSAGGGSKEEQSTCCTYLLSPFSVNGGDKSDENNTRTSMLIAASASRVGAASLGTGIDGALSTETALREIVQQARRTILEIASSATLSP